MSGCLSIRCVRVLCRVCALNMVHTLCVPTGAAHSKCNLKLRLYAKNPVIPVVFHNLKNYDGHHLISAIGTTEVEEVTYTDARGVRKRTKRTGDISIVANNMEKYVTFSWRQFR